MAEMQRKREKSDVKKKENEPSEVLESVMNQLNESLTEKSETEKIDLSSFSSERVIPPSNQTIDTEISSQESILNDISTETLQKPILEPGKIDPRIKPIIPQWVNKPWRWMVPDDIEHKKQWLITWGEFILDFARILNLHIIDLQEISLVYPFYNTLTKKKLSIPQLILISDYLVEINKAKWWDEQKTRLRIYWKTLITYCDDLFEFAFKNGYEMVTAYDIIQMKQSWSTLPGTDIKTIMKLLVETKRASWADSEKKTIEFHFN